MRKLQWLSPPILLLCGVVLLAVAGGLTYYVEHSRQEAAESYAKLTLGQLQQPVAGVFVAVNRTEWTLSGVKNVEADPSLTSPEQQSRFAAAILRPLHSTDDPVRVELVPVAQSIGCSKAQAFKTLTVELHTQGFDVDPVGNNAHSGGNLYRQLCLLDPPVPWIWELHSKNAGLHDLTFHIVPQADAKAGEDALGSSGVKDIDLVTVVPAPSPILEFIRDIFFGGGVLSLIIAVLKDWLFQRLGLEKAPAKPTAG